jgi:hypothetical protein
MKVPAILTTFNDRFLRAAALREETARAWLPADKRAALEQATLLVEIARRVAKPVEELPPGARPAARLGLLRDAAYWALLAGRSEGIGAPPWDLRAALDELPPEGLPGVEPRTFDAIKRALLETPATSLAVPVEDADLVAAFADKLVADLNAPRVRAERIRGQRWARMLACLVGVALLGYGVRVLALGPNLAADKPYHTSSTWAGCPADPNCVPLAFCTDSQADPWAVLDLGRPTRFHRIEVTNRGDCCGERAVPLIVEVSTDDIHYREVARRTEEFSSWTIKLAPLTARYVRFKVPRTTVFHLKQVAIR